MKKFKRELIRYGRLIHKEELVVGQGGNISVRVNDKMYIKASRASLENSKESDYSEVDLTTGRARSGGKPPSVEAPMHLACYKSRPDIGAVIHTHPVYGTIIAMMAKKIGFVSYEFMCSLSTEVPVINYKRSGSRELAGAVKKKIKKHNAVLLKNHGALVVGKDLKEAYERSLVLERACRIYVLSKLAGKASMIR